MKKKTSIKTLATRTAMTLLIAMLTMTAQSAWAYTITKNVTGQGTLSVTVGGQEVTSADAGTTITVTIEAADTYIRTGLGLMKESGEGMNFNTQEETITRIVYTFEMPESNVIVNAEFGKPTHYVSGVSETDKEQNTIISIEPDSKRAEVGATVTLTVTLGTGVVLNSLSAATMPSFEPGVAPTSPVDVALTKVDDTHYTFTMPSYGVEVLTQYAIALYDNATNDDVITAHYDEYDSYMLSGRTLYRDGSWNTLCLPFDIYGPNVTWDTSSPLYGATIKELDASASGLSEEGVLTLTFKDAELDSDYNIIQAGKPNIVKWNTEENLSNITNPVFSARMKGTAPTSTCPPTPPQVSPLPATS